MDMRTEHGHQGRTMHSHSIDHGTLYKQLVEYCCGSLSSSLVNTQLMFPLDIPTERFIVCAFIRHWSSVKIVNGGLYFILFFHFILLYFSFVFFYFQNNSGQGLSVTLSHQSQIDGVVTRLIMRLGRRKQKILEQSDIIQHGQHMLASCYTHGHLGQGAQQLARTMGNSI